MYYPGADLALSVDEAARELVKAEGPIQLMKAGLWIVPGLLLSSTRKADKVDDGREAPKGGPKLLNPPINITQKGLQHVVDRHTASGIAKFASKSKFNPGENIADLITAGTQQPMVQQAGGRFARTFDVGRNIGLDRATGGQTSIMTIITEGNGSLVTAFPGVP
jgi:hypothetical protein